MMGKTPRRAVVIGASIAGLLTGRVLADHFDEVLLLDKEDLDGGAAPRKAVPQGNHIHAILTPTYRTLQRFLPEVIDDLRASGANLFDGGIGIRFLIHGEALSTGHTDQPIIGCTRPFFEHHLRQRVRATQNLTILTGRRLIRWVPSEDRSRISSIVVSGSGSEEETLEADLFIDARGRSSSLRADLEQLGYEVPEEELVGVDLGYTSRLYRAPDFDPGWSLLLLNAYAPDVAIGGVVERVENGQWIATQFGYFGDHAPADDEGFLDYARRHYAPDVLQFLRVAEPISDFHRFGTKECKMVRFEKLETFPDRLLPVGDTVCNLNPVYGQGMTKAANEAWHLADTLSEHLKNTQSLEGFTDQVRRSLPNVGAEWAWQLTTGADLGFPATIGRRPPGSAFMGWYMKRLFLRAAHSLDTRRRIFDVTMLSKPPPSLFAPRMVLHAMGF